MNTATQNIGTPEQHPLSELRTYHRNPRVGDVEVIAASMATNGVYKPLVVNRGTHTGRAYEVLAGNHSLKAMRLLAERHPEDARWHTAECWIVDVDNDQAARIVLVDNRAADLGDYDQESLVGLLSSLDGDLDGTGYDLDDLADLSSALDELDEVEAHTDPDESPKILDGPTITQPGDVIDLGAHRVYCGDSTDTEQVIARLMHDGVADCVWTDPPYGVDYVGKTKDALTIQNDGAAGLPELLSGAMKTIVAAARPGAPVYVAHADTERIAFETAMRDAGLLVRQNLIWVKNTLVLGRSDYHYRHEPILYGFTPGGEGRLGRGGSRWYGDDAQTTVIECDKPPTNADHPTMKPVALIQTMLVNSCPKGGIVLDLFGGSGSTLIAAHHHHAHARLVELDPRYVDVICRRFQEHTGITPLRNGEPTDYQEVNNAQDREESR